MKRVNLENGCYKEISISGNIYYYNKDNKRHREDSPAIERADGTNEWYINDELAIIKLRNKTTATKMDGD